MGLSVRNVVVLAAHFPCLALAATTTTVSLTVSPTLSPDSALQTVSPSFLGFAFEQASFYNFSFSADGTPNTFSQNLINAVVKRTGGSPIIRVGGTSGDRAHFNASQTNATNYPATTSGTRFQAPWLSIGRPFFDAFLNFDALGVKYIFQVPWNRAGVWRWQEEGYQNALTWAEAGMDVIGMQRLEALEIGNEPNFYLGKQGITAEQYASRYRAIQASLIQRLPELGNQRIFQALDIADGAATRYDTQPFFTTDGGLSEIATSIKQVAYHYYQGSGVNTIAELQDWVSHSRTKRLLSVFENDITFLRNNHPAIRFIIDEVADNVGPGAASASIYNVLATALWRVDFMLQAIVIGVDRVNWQQIFNDKICMWLPVKSKRAGGPRVLADYYALPFVADFIGPSGQTQVSELNIADSSNGMLAAYAAYDGGTLARIALINLDVWQSGDGARPASTFRLDVGSGQGSATIRRLSARDGALAKESISWAGLQWTWKNQGDPEESEETQSAQIGVVEVVVHASSAVMVSLP